MERLGLPFWVLLGTLAGVGVGLVLSPPPAQDCQPIEVIRWLEVPAVEGVTRTEWGRPDADWLQQFESGPHRAPEKAPATIPADPVETATEPAPEPRGRHHRRHWRHWRRR